MKNFSKLLVFLVFLLATMTASARKFYISATGNDANSGLSISSPWQTLTKVKNFAYAGSAAAGDTFAFKCGDVFYTVNQWDGLNWRGGGFQGMNCASGTANAPIVFTSYGSGAKPNLLFPQPSTVVARSVLTFIRVNYIIVENLQFNDTRFNSSDKITPAYTLVGVKLGDWESSGDSSASFSNHCIVRNCNFNNVSLPIVYNGNYNKIYNNTMTNLPNAVVDGIGSYGANGITCTGSYDTITNNSITGAWAYSSYFGLNGGAIELYNVNNYNFIGYNTFSDCGGIGEFGAGKANQTGNYNTFAYNKILNCGDVSYANISGTFAIQCKNIRFWNNVIIENNASRFSGPNFGAGFTGFTTYPTPATKFFSNNGSPVADTVWDLRNNIFWIVNKTGSSTYTINNGTKTVHINNLYRLTNGAVPGYTLSGSESLTSNKNFIDTSNTDPLYWDFNLISTSPAINTGTNVGLSPDFNGNVVSGTPSIGILQYTTTPPVPPTNYCTSYTYSQWSNCVNGIQTRTAVGSPAGCVGTPDSALTRACVTPSNPCVFTYGPWSVCNGTTQTRTYTVGPSGCTGSVVPPDSISRSCTIPPLVLTLVRSNTASCLNKYDGSIYVSASGGLPGYSFSINSATVYTANRTLFTGLRPGSYIIRVKDSRGVTTLISVAVYAKRNRNC
jgi:hypothetical protein